MPTLVEVGGPNECTWPVYCTSTGEQNNRHEKVVEPPLSRYTCSSLAQREKLDLLHLVEVTLLEPKESVKFVLYADNLVVYGRIGYKSSRP